MDAVPQFVALRPYVEALPLLVEHAHLTERVSCVRLELHADREVRQCAIEVIHE